VGSPHVSIERSFSRISNLAHLTNERIFSFMIEFMLEEVTSFDETFLADFTGEWSKFEVSQDVNADVTFCLELFITMIAADVFIFLFMNDVNVLLESSIDKFFITKFALFERFFIVNRFVLNQAKLCHKFFVTVRTFEDFS
jgi:hypothetical protein